MTSATEPRSKRRRREETKQRLLDAALSVFAANGYERATVDEIVREAGFSKGAFYVHFGSKEDLFWEMLQEHVSSQQEMLRQALDVDAPVAENERRILAAIFAQQAQDSSWPAMFMEFTAHAGRNEKVRERLAALYDSWHQFTVEMLQAAGEAGRLREGLDLDFTASVLIALVEGSIMQARISQDAARLERMVEPLSKLLAEWLGR